MSLFGKKRERNISAGAAMRREFTINGKDFDDLEGFYCEIDKILTKDLAWKTGHNLDALNDLLRGGFGVHEYGEPIKLIWKNFSKSRADFGYAATIKYFEAMLEYCHPSNRGNVAEALASAKLNRGDTLLNMIVNIITDSNDTGHNCVLEMVE
jgi:RNAse (barnase) inhibitor barstar